MYGRLVSVHHVSPYTHVPANFSRDPLLPLVAVVGVTPVERRSGFVALSAVGTALTGSSELVTRLFFQLVEAAALVAALLLVWRRTRDSFVSAFIALNPALIVVVNGGHNDIVVGLTLLVGALSLADGRPRLAGFVLAAGAELESSSSCSHSAPCCCGHGVVVHRARALRPARTGGSLLAAYVASGGTDALGPIVHASTQHSRSSLWQLATQWLAEPLSVARSSVFRIEGHAALVVVATVVVLVVIWITRSGSPSSRDAPTGVVVAATSVLVFLFAGSYILPWYSAWALLPLALVWNSVSWPSPPGKPRRSVLPTPRPSSSVRCSARTRRTYSRRCCSLRSSTSCGRRGTTDSGARCEYVGGPRTTTARPPCRSQSRDATACPGCPTRRSGGDGHRGDGGSR